jgi:hypothetical protein
MNMLACRLAKAKGKGDQMVDGQKYNRSFLKKVSGYVMQVLARFLLPGDLSFIRANARSNNQQPTTRTICSSPTSR